MNPAEIQFTVYGLAQTAGSKRAFVVQAKICKKCGYKVSGAEIYAADCPRCGHPRPGPKAVTSDDNPKSDSWKNEVATAARRVYRGPLLDDPLRVTFRFFRPRPKGHFKSSGELNAKGQREFVPATKPDVLKLARCAEDALTGVIWRDDALICSEVLEKEWGEPARLEVLIDKLSLSDRVRNVRAEQQRQQGDLLR